MTSAERAELVDARAEPRRPRDDREQEQRQRDAGDDPARAELGDEQEAGEERPDDAPGRRSRLDAADDAPSLLDRVEREPRQHRSRSARGSSTARRRGAAFSQSTWRIAGAPLGQLERCRRKWTRPRIASDASEPAT